MKNYSILAATMLLAVCCTVLNLAFNEHIGNDTGNYYVRMAEEFAAGNYSAAFFHIVPPLTPLLAGIVAKAGLSGWMAMKLVSGLFFLASVYWCYRLARLRLSDYQAQWCALLFVLCSKLLRYGMGGQLEAAKVFLFLFICERLLVWLDSRRWNQLLSIAFGVALLALSRNEGIGYLPLVLGMLFLADWIPPFKKPSCSLAIKRGFLRCICVLGICMAVWSPWIIYQFNITGYAVLSSKQIPIVGKLMPWVNIEESNYIRAYAEKEARAVKYLLEEEPAAKKVSNKGLVDWFKNAEPCTTPFKLSETFKGLYPRYFIFAVFGIISLVRQRKWNRMDTLLALLFGYHVAVYWLLSNNILLRLIIPGIPLYFPWMILGAIAVARVLRIDLRKKIHKGILIILATAIVASLLPSGMSSVRKSLRGKDDLEITIAEWIRSNREALDTNPAPPLKSGIYVRDYHTGRQPVVMGFNTLPYRAGADGMLQDSLPRIPHEQFVELCEEKGLDVIITGKSFYTNFSKVDLSDSRFLEVEHPWKDQGVIVYTFTP